MIINVLGWRVLIHGSAKYLERIKALKDTSDIKSNFADANIIFIDYMDLEFEEIKEYHVLHKYVEDRYDKEKKNYIFVDEVR